MVESSDLQGAVARTQAMERIQALQAQQDELNRKRFELEMQRQRAEKGKKVEDPRKAEHKRVVRDRYDGGGGGQGSPQGEERPGASASRDDEPPDDERGRKVDVRV